MAKKPKSWEEQLKESLKKMETQQPKTGEVAAIALMGKAGDKWKKGLKEGFRGKSKKDVLETWREMRKEEAQKKTKKTKRTSGKKRLKYSTSKDVQKTGPALRKQKTTGKTSKDIQKFKGKPKAQEGPTRKQIKGGQPPRQKPSVKTTPRGVGKELQKTGPAKTGPAKRGARTGTVEGWRVTPSTRRGGPKTVESSVNRKRIEYKPKQKKITGQRPPMIPVIPPKGPPSGGGTPKGGFPWMKALGALGAAWPQSLGDATLSYEEMYPGYGEQPVEKHQGSMIDITAKKAGPVSPGTSSASLPAMSPLGEQLAVSPDILNWKAQGAPETRRKPAWYDNLDWEAIIRGATPLLTDFLMGGTAGVGENIASTGLLGMLKDRQDRADAEAASEAKAKEAQANRDVTMRGQDITARGQDLNYNAKMQKLVVDQAEAMRKAAQEGKMDPKLANSMFNTYNAAPEVKEARESASRLEGLVRNYNNPTAAGDITFIYDFIKAIDPDSVVKFSEVELAQQGLTFEEAFKNFLTRFGMAPYVPWAFAQGKWNEYISDGERRLLSDKYKHDLLMAATKRMEGIRARRVELDKRYNGFYKDMGAPKSIFVNTGDIDPSIKNAYTAMKKVKKPKSTAKKEDTVEIDEKSLPPGFIIKDGRIVKE